MLRGKAQVLCDPDNRLPHLRIVAANEHVTGEFLQMRGGHVLKRRSNPDGVAQDLSPHEKGSMTASVSSWLA